MWTIKVFKTKEKQQAFLKANQNKYQMIEVFINNAFGLEIKKLIKIY